MGRTDADFGRLPLMSPADEFGSPRDLSRYPRLALVSREMVMAVAGGVLILASGWLLALVFALAGMAAHGLEGQASRREMLGKVIGLAFGGKVSWLALLGLVLGVTLIVGAFRRAGAAR